MRRIIAVALLVAVPCVVARGEPRVVAAYAASGGAAGEVYHVDVRGLDDVVEGSVLIAYRRVPARRGDAEFRSHPVWMESGRLRVVGLSDGWATASQLTGPPTTLPAVDRDGLPRDRVCIGDRVVETGENALSEQRIVGEFDLRVLFGDAGDAVTVEGERMLRLWLGRFAVRGPIRVNMTVAGQRSGPVDERTVHESIAVADGADTGTWADLERREMEVARARRCAGALARCIEGIVGLPAGDVLATVSFAERELQRSGQAVIVLLDAHVRPQMRPDEMPGETVEPSRDGLVSR